MSIENLALLGLVVEDPGDATAALGVTLLPAGQAHEVGGTAGRAVERRIAAAKGKLVVALVGLDDGLLDRLLGEVLERLGDLLPLAGDGRAEEADDRVGVRVLVADQRALQGLRVALDVIAGRPAEGKPGVHHAGPDSLGADLLLECGLKLVPKELVVPRLDVGIDLGGRRQEHVCEAPLVVPTLEGLLDQPAANIDLVVKNDHHEVLVVPILERSVQVFGSRLPGGCPEGCMDFGALPVVEVGNAPREPIHVLAINKTLDLSSLRCSHVFKRPKFKLSQGLHELNYSGLC